MSLLQFEVQTLAQVIDSQAAFFELTLAAQIPGAILFEINKADSPYAGLAIGIYRSSLCIKSRGGQFQIQALEPNAEILLKKIVPEIAAVAQIEKMTNDLMIGSLIPDLTHAELNQRLQSLTHADLLRILLKLFPTQIIEKLPIGLYGSFGYDFVKQMEKVLASQNDILNDPDAIFYLPAKLFICDTRAQKTHFINLYFSENTASPLEKDILIAKNAMTPTLPKNNLGEVISDTNYQEYQAALDKIQQAILNGDAFQVVYGRLLSADFHGNPFAIYTALKKINPSPYHFFMRDADGILVGASPELALRVARENEKYKVAIHPIAGSRPRGINSIMDQRFEISLQTDPKELAEHTMLIDLGRNDIASIAEMNTTQVDYAYHIEKYSHVQHLVSQVSGILNSRYDALTAYLATMNMGTLTGAPKPSALKIIAELEKNARGLFGGGFGFITPNNELEMTIIIRSLRFKNNKVFVRAASGIVADSIVAKEWEETEVKAAACLRALVVSTECNNKIDEKS